jgi:hypothetical protein
VLGLGPSAVIAMPSCGSGIFSETSRPGTVDPGSPRTARRLRRVELDLPRLFPGGLPPSVARSAERITLNLFPDVCVTASREQATDLGPGKMQWIGRVEGRPGGTAILVVDGSVMVGTVTIDRRSFRIAYLGDGVHTVVEVDQSAFPPD